jgi:hypothetical protein
MRPALANQRSVGAFLFLILIFLSSPTFQDADTGVITSITVASYISSTNSRLQVPFGLEKETLTLCKFLVLEIDLSDDCHRPPQINICH